MNDVVWVTSAYLLAYAVPVLITGRLGDRFGPKNLYLAGLAVFTAASLWCGLTGSIEMLIVARVFQGLGASMITPQTMAIITRIFPAARRGAAMALWGATAGVASLVGPILGGVLIDGPAGSGSSSSTSRSVSSAWCWPGAWCRASRPTSHRFDWLGVALSGVGMFLVVFGLQEGHQRDWAAVDLGDDRRPARVFGLFVALAGAQPRRAARPARHLPRTATSPWPTSRSPRWASWSRPCCSRSCSTPSSSAASSPTRAALLLVPMALMSIVLARPSAG